MTPDTTTKNPFLTAIPTLMVGTFMLVFLIVSFILFKRRLSLKRKRGIEYMRYYLYTHPCVTQEQYEAEEIPIRNKVTVMTNTHFENMNELLINDITEQDNVKRQAKEPKSKKGKKCGKRLSCKQTGDNASSSSKSGTIVNKETATNYTFAINEQHMDQVKSLQDNGKNQRKKSRKKRKKFLKLLARKTSSLGDAGSKHTTIELQEDRYTRKEKYIPTKQGKTKSKYENGVDSSPFFEEDGAYHATRTIENVYYEDAGLPFNGTKESRNKKIRKAETAQETGNILKLSKPDTLKQNAFYDSMTFVQEPKKRYKELVHRDSRGNISFKCRSLPQLETEFNDTVLSKENKMSLEREKIPRSNSKAFGHLHEYDILF